MSTRRLLLSPLVFLVALLTVLGGGTVSASAGHRSETRVRALDTAVVDGVGQPSRETPGSVGCLRPTQPGLASGSCVATNTARLNLPFRDAGLRSQVDDVVRHFDEFGTPPTGVAQGGLKGHPTGTYGGQGLPQKPLGYYTESDVWVSGGGVKRGAERLVFGQGGEVYYTPTHYDDFVRIR